MILCTFPDATVAAEIGRKLLEANLAACINVLPGARSIFRWRGEISEEQEAVALIKTTRTRRSELTTELVRLHPYDCPEVLTVAIAGGHQPYLDWVIESCGAHHAAG